MTARTIYQGEKEHFTYDAANSWLTVHQCGGEWSITIGPLGLIDLGLELCAIARGLGTDSDVYSHPDGVFHIEYDDGELMFTEGARFAVVPMTDSNLLDFGLELIGWGYYDVSAGREGLYFEQRYGGRVTFSDGDDPVNCEIQFNNRLSIWMGEVPTGPYSGGHLDDLDEAIERLTTYREEMRVKFGGHHD